MFIIKIVIIIKSLSPISHTALSSKLALNAKNKTAKILKDSKSTDLNYKSKENKLIDKLQEKTFYTNESIKESHEKAPLIDLATDYYEGADVVEIDMGLSYNSSINNNSLLNSKNFAFDENLNKNKIDSLININFSNTDKRRNKSNKINYHNHCAENFEIIDDEKSSIIDDFRMKVNYKQNYDGKLLIQELENLNNDEDEHYIENNTIFGKIMCIDNVSEADKIQQSTPSVKKIRTLKNLNTENNNTFKFPKTNFESIRNMNTNLNLNLNKKNIETNKSTKKHSLIKSNTNTLKSEDTDAKKEKEKEKLPHSKTLKILKNNHLNFMNNAFKALAETQTNNLNDKAQRILTFSKEKENIHTLSFRLITKRNNHENTNILSMKNKSFKNTLVNNNPEANSNYNKKNGLKAKEKNPSKIETYKTRDITLNQKQSFLNHKLVFNTTSDLKEDLKKPYSQDKEINQRKFMTDKSLNKNYLKESTSKNNLNYTLKESNNKKKLFRQAILQKMQEQPCKKKFEKIKNENNNLNLNREKTLNNKISDITFISNRNFKDSDTNNKINCKKIKYRKSVSNNQISYFNNEYHSNNNCNGNNNYKANQNLQYCNTNSNNCNYFFTINQTTANTNSEKNILTEKKNSLKKVIYMNANNINLLDKKPKMNNYLSSNNDKENLKIQKLSHNISQKYLKQFFSNQNNNAVIGNGNTNFNMENTKLIKAQNGIANKIKTTITNTSFKSNYEDSIIPEKNKLEISFESADEMNLNENVFIEEIKITKTLKKDPIIKKKIFDSPPLIGAKKVITKMLNRPVSEYKLIDLKDYTNTEENKISNNSEIIDANNRTGKNPVLTESASDKYIDLNFKVLKNEFRNNKLYDRLNNKNQLNHTNRLNNTFRNTLNINLNSKRNYNTHKNKNNKINNDNNIVNKNATNNNFDRVNTYSNNKVSILKD